ncbi:hypothetical protein Tco_0945872, partial [Tanacetum coccineum]
DDEDVSMSLDKRYTKCLTRYLYSKGGTLKKLDRVMGNIDFVDMFPVVQKMRMLKKPLRKLLHDQGNLHDRVNRFSDEEAAYLTAFNKAKKDEE